MKAARALAAVAAMAVVAMLCTLGEARKVKFSPEPISSIEFDSTSVVDSDSHPPFRCIYDELPKRKVKVSVQKYAPHPAPVQKAGKEEEEEAPKAVAAAAYEPIRITLDLSLLEPGTDVYACNETYAPTGYTCDPDNDILTDAKKAYLSDTVLPAAVNWLESAYSVWPVLGNLVMTETDCSANSQTVYVQPTYRTTGVANTDLLLFVTARPAASGILAFARACETDSKGRAIAGHINFNPLWLKPNIDPEALIYRTQEVVTTAIHEIHHVLGFDFTIMSRFYDPDAGVLRAADWALTTMASGNTASVNAVKSPEVLSYAREYFGCPTLQAVPLEDGGGSGTVDSHWEKRLFFNEFLTGSISTNPLITRFTMALMQDSGWYMANYSVAANLTWGKGDGCTLFSEPCLPNHVGSLFCNTNGEYGCTFDRLSSAQCVVEEYTSALPTEYQYFSSPTTGGSDELLDYCPYYVPVYSGDCRYGETVITGDYDFGIVHGSTSRCFGSSLVYGNNIRTFTGSCMKYVCTGANSLRVYVRGIWYPCPWGTSITAFGFNGTLQCPDASENFCADKTIEDSSTWPTISDVNPRRGASGAVVVITGQNFVSPMRVVFGDYNASLVVVDSSSQMTVTLPEMSIASASSLTSAELLTYIVVSDPRGYTDVASDAFVLEFQLISSGVSSSILEWIKANVLLVVLVAVALAAVIGIAAFVVVRHRMVAKKRIADERMEEERKRQRQEERLARIAERRKQIRASKRKAPRTTPVPVAATPEQVV